MFGNIGFSSVRFRSVQFSSVRSVMSDSLWPHGLQHSRLSYHQLPEFIKLMSIESVMPSNHLILCRPLFLLPSIFPSFRVFSNESALHIRWPKYWSFSFNISLSNEYSGLISFSMDWLDLLAVQGTLESLLQHRSSKAMLNGLLCCCKLFWTPLLQVEKPHLWKQKSSHGLSVSHSSQDGHTTGFQKYLPWTQKLPDLVSHLCSLLGICFILFPLSLTA